MENFLVIRNTYGELFSRNPNDFAKKPIEIPKFSHKKIISVGCGSFFSLVVLIDHDENQRFYVSGSNYHGQLCIGNTDNQKQPCIVKFKFPDRIKKVVGGSFHSLILLKNGTALSCGCGSDGRLGIGKTSDITLPKEITSLSMVKIDDCDCGWRFSLFVDSKNELYMTGEFNSGRYNRDVMHSPVKIEGMMVKKIFCAKNSYAILDDNGKVWCGGTVNNIKLDCTYWKGRNKPGVFRNFMFFNNIGAVDVKINHSSLVVFSRNKNVYYHGLYYRSNSSNEFGKVPLQCAFEGSSLENKVCKIEMKIDEVFVCQRGLYFSVNNGKDMCIVGKSRNGCFGLHARENKDWQKSIEITNLLCKDILDVKIPFLIRQLYIEKFVDIIVRITEM